MSHLEFNIKAKFVYTKLLPLLREATRDMVDSVNYEAREDEETVVVHFNNGSETMVDVTANGLLSLTQNVVKAVLTC